MGRPIGRWHPDYWKKRAGEFREELMQRNSIMVGQEPFIARVIMLEVKWIGGASNKNYWRRDMIKPAIDSMRQRVPGRTPIVKAGKRMWAVYIGDEVFVLWERHVMAAATLEALRFHYAKHVMVMDTEAAGYV